MSYWLVHRTPNRVFRGCFCWTGHCVVRVRQEPLLWSIVALLQDPITWYGMNYTGTQITQCMGLSKQGKLGWTGKSSFVLEVPLCYLRPSIIYSVPCDWMVERTYWIPDLENSWEATP